MKYEIVALAKEQWKGTVLPIGYTAEEYYDVEMSRDSLGFGVRLQKKRFEAPVTHTPEECDFADKLYADWWENAFAWGVVDGGRLVAAIETAPEEWSNRLRVTELWVDPAYHRQGLGRALMDVAKEQARLERRRAIILETQSSNVNAIAFYLHEGFELIGMDVCCYSNDDIKKRSVRLELGILRRPGERLTRAQVTIRPETENDYRASEIVTQRAFWNRFHRGCSEHLLVRKLRAMPDYLPELSRVAVLDGEIIGGIWYIKAKVVDGDKVHVVPTFGPLSIAPEHQGRGVGEFLLKETLALAAQDGYPGVVMYGVPDYYPRLGFSTCDHFGITTPDGKNFDALMGIELAKGRMAEVRGKFYEPDVYENLPEEEVEALNQAFPPLVKHRFPKQWD